MKRTYFLPFLTALIISNQLSAQEIRLTTAGDNIDVPEFKSIKPLAELNTKGADAYPYLSPDGLTIYYTQGTNVYESRLVTATRATLNDMFADAQPVSTVIPAGSMSCWLSNDQKDIYYVKEAKLYHASRPTLKNEFSDPVEVKLNNSYGFIAGPSLSPDGKDLYIYNSTSARRILRFTRMEDNSFELAGALRFPPGYEANPGQLSKDGLRYYITLGPEGSEKMYMLSRESLTDEFDAAAVLESLGTYEGGGQPSVSGDGNSIVFVRSNGMWTDNDLCISTSDKMNSLQFARKYDVSLDVHPNPFSSNASLQFSLDKGEQVKIGLYTLSGYEVAVLSDEFMSEGDHVLTLDRAGLPQGIYIAKLQTQGKIKAQRVVITD
jgi:hypothetical protein